MRTYMSPSSGNERMFAICIFFPHRHSGKAGVPPGKGSPPIMRHHTHRPSFEKAHLDRGMIRMQPGTGATRIPVNAMSTTGRQFSRGRRKYF